MRHVHVAHYAGVAVSGGLTGILRLPTDDGAEDVVGFEEQCKGIDEKHDASGPDEELKGQSRSEGWLWERLGLAEDQAADKRDAGGEG